MDCPDENTLRHRVGDIPQYAEHIHLYHLDRSGAKLQGAQYRNSKAVLPRCLERLDNGGTRHIGQRRQAVTFTEMVWSGNPTTIRF